MKTSTLVFMIVVSTIYGAIITSIILKSQKMVITTAECPTLQPTENISYISIEGMKCEEREGSYTDLLQPSGLWGNRLYSCWKLEIPIEEWCKTNPCVSNNYKN
jgi:hypothetical protein